jgi:hypothetical protein
VSSAIARGMGDFAGIDRSSMGTIRPLAFLVLASSLRIGVQ